MSVGVKLWVPTIRKDGGHARDQRNYRQRPYSLRRDFCDLRHSRPFFKLCWIILEGGQTLDEFLDDFPKVTREAAIFSLK